MNSAQQQKYREFRNDYLQKYKLLEMKDNVIDAPKAFVANSILKEITIKTYTKVWSETQADEAFKLLSDFINGKIVIFWDGASLKKKVLDNTNDKKTKMQEP